MGTYHTQGPGERVGEGNAFTHPGSPLTYAFAYWGTLRREVVYCARAVRYPGQDWFRQNPRTPIEQAP